MKGSPIIATIVIILILLGLYIGTRTILLNGNDTVNTDPHAGHNHSQHSEDSASNGHDDSSLETQFEITFSSKPKSLKITQPSTQKTILETTEFESLELLTTANMSLDGHHVELAVQVEWEAPQAMNIAIISVSPARHASKEATLKSDSNIDDIAEFHW